MVSWIPGLHKVALTLNLDPLGRLMVTQVYGTDIGLPISVLIDGNGIVRSVHSGLLRQADIPELLDHLK